AGVAVGQHGGMGAGGVGGHGGLFGGGALLGQFEGDESAGDGVFVLVVGDEVLGKIPTGVKFAHDDAVEDLVTGQAAIEVDLVAVGIAFGLAGVLLFPGEI